MLALVLLAACPGKTLQEEPAGPRVVAPVREILPGTVLLASDLGSVPAPDPASPRFADPSDLVGRTAAERLLPGEPIRRERLADPSVSGLYGVIPRGMLAVPIDPPCANVGDVRPGDYVDVLAAPPAAIRVQAAQVVDADTTCARAADDRARLLVSLTPEDAERVVSLQAGTFAVARVPAPEVTWLREHGPSCDLPPEAVPCGDAGGVPVARRDLNPGLPVAADDVACVAGGLPLAVAGREVRERILCGEIVREERLSDVAGPRAGQRAIGLPVLADAPPPGPGPVSLDWGKPEDPVRVSATLVRLDGSAARLVVAREDLPRITKLWLETGGTPRLRAP